MTLPASWTLVPITGTFLDLAGTPCVGKVHFVSAQPVVIDDVVVVPKRIVATLNGTGELSVNLPATDDPDLSVTGWTYQVEEHFRGGRPAYRLAVPYNSAGIDLSTAPIAPPTDPVDVSQYVGPQGLSAYQVAVAAGFVGNVAAWLASLVGDPGDPGPEGDAGVAGNSMARPASALTSASGVVTVDLGSGTEVYTLALTENVTSWVFNNLPAAGFVAEIRIDVTQHASSAKTCVSPATAGTAGGAWTQSATLSSVESLGLAITSAGARRLYPSGLLT